MVVLEAPVSWIKGLINKIHLISDSEVVVQSINFDNVSARWENNKFIRNIKLLIFLVAFGKFLLIEEMV